MTAEIDTTAAAAMETKTVAEREDELAKRRARNYDMSGEYAVFAVRVNGVYKPLFATRLHSDSWSTRIPDLPQWTCLGGITYGTPDAPGAGASMTLAYGDNPEEAVEAGVKILSGECDCCRSADAEVSEAD